jgi:hypothetical protein
MHGPKHVIEEGAWVFSRQLYQVHRFVTPINSYCMILCIAACPQYMA